MLEFVLQLDFGCASRVSNAHIETQGRVRSCKGIGLVTISLIFQISPLILGSDTDHSNEHLLPSFYTTSEIFSKPNFLFGCANLYI